MQKASFVRGPGSLVLVLAAVVAGGCSSSGAAPPPQGSTSGTTTTGGTGGSSGTGGGGSSSCEKVIVNDSEFPIGFDPRALATSDGKIYALIDDVVGRTVRVAENGKLVEVARAPREEDFDLNGSNLLVDANGYFFDVFQDGKKWLVGAPPVGSAVKIAQFTDSKEIVDPPFLGDATSLFFVGQAPTSKVVMRVPRVAAAATSPIVVTDDMAFYNGLTALAGADSSIFAVSGFGTSYTAREYPKEPNMPPRSSKLANFVQSICSTFAVPPHVLAGTDALYLGCLQSGGSQEAIYRLPFSQQWPASEADVAVDPPLVSGKVASDSFIVVQTTVYFANYEQDAVFKVPSTGGAPSRVLGAYNVNHMASDGTTLFVQSGCGLQSTPL